MTNFTTTAAGAIQQHHPDRPATLTITAKKHNGITNVQFAFTGELDTQLLDAVKRELATTELQPQATKAGGGK